VHHFRTHAPQQTARLFDHRDSAAEQRCRDINAKRLCGIEVDHSSNLVGRSTGMSAGLAPLRILSTRPAARGLRERLLSSLTRLQPNSLWLRLRLAFRLAESFDLHFEVRGQLLIFFE
jgi:hypothetical protein